VLACRGAPEIRIVVRLGHTGPSVSTVQSQGT
jgi:hypothetical protein